MAIQISIPTTVNATMGFRRVTFYAITLTDPETGDAKCVHKRFTEFRTLRTRLIALKQPDLFIPAIPPKKAIGRFHPDVIELRRVQFEKFLRFVVETPSFLPLFKQWIESENTAFLNSLAGKDPVGVVLSKLTALTAEEDLDFLAKQAADLANKERLKSRYLHFDWDSTWRLFEEFRSTAKYGNTDPSGASPPLTLTTGINSTSEAPHTQAPTTNNSNSLFASSREDTSHAIVQEEPDNVDDDDEDDEDEEEDEDGLMPELNPAEIMLMRPFNPSTDRGKKQGQALKVKLVIAEIVHKSASKSLRRVLCPIVSTIGPYFDHKAPPFGIFHSALIIGPWYIEWNNSHLCVPRKIMSKAALISCDIEGIPIRKQNIEDVRDKLAEVITHWNSKKQYNNRPKNRDVEGNCQDFVEDVLKKLGMHDTLQMLTSADSPLGHFLRDMRDKGRCNISFTMTDDFREKFGITERTRTFKTHEELDNFVIQLMEKCQELGKNNPKDEHFRWAHSKEWDLLKSFDRAFWLRSLRDQQNPDYLPKRDPDAIDSDITHNHLCPFGDPISSGSFHPNKL